MLQKIFIQNYALIDRLELNFEKGLNIITGETGAGKSILLGACSLLLGQRADSTSLLDKSRKCIMEAEFNVADKIIRQFFTTHELDIQHPLVIRREISPEGKSRSFINDTPVNLSLLKELGTQLVDIHSQHETLLLNTTGFQLSVVDAFAGHEASLESYTGKFRRYKSLSKELHALVEAEKKSAADADYFRFQMEELTEAGLQPGEQEKWEAELQSLTHSEEIKAGTVQGMALAGEGDGNILAQLASLHHLLQTLSRFDSRLEQTGERVKSILIEMKDIAAELEQIGDSVHFSPERIAWINDRLNTLYRLQQKHRTQTILQLLEIREEFSQKLSNMDSLSERINQAREQCQVMQNELIVEAREISKSRMKAIPKIEKEIAALLKEVAMPHAVLKIENEVLKETDLSENGLDSIRFLFSANKGIAYQDLSKVASGGELSRLMLCLKSLMARLTDLPTIVFDEIDTGVSGETALKVGKLLHAMSLRHQMIAITHLPQIAGRGEAHYFVYKDTTGKKTFTQVRRLSAEERIVEIAKMLSGEKPSVVAIENAKELLSHP